MSDERPTKRHLDILFMLHSLTPVLKHLKTSASITEDHIVINKSHYCLNTHLYNKINNIRVSVFQNITDKMLDLKTWATDIKWRRSDPGAVKGWEDQRPEHVQHKSANIFMMLLSGGVLKATLHYWITNNTTAIRSVGIVLSPAFSLSLVICYNTHSCKNISTSSMY